MSIPTTYRAWSRSEVRGGVKPTISVTEEKLPSTLQPTEVTIRIHAVSLNYRDVGMLSGNYTRDVDPGIVASDCAAEVVQVGSQVQRVRVGDRVSVLFDIYNIDGTDRGPMMALGGDIDGVLREYAVYDEQSIVKLPDVLSWKEGSTLACAGVTAWNALRMNELIAKGLQKDWAVLLEGTGGVSMFSLLFCLAAGIRPIITSSDDNKLKNIRELAAKGKIETVNYKTQSVVEEVKRITNGLGVDVVVNNSGPGSIEQNVEVLRRRGTISLVGFLAGMHATVDPGLLLQFIPKAATLVGMNVGSRDDFDAMNKFIAEKQVDLKPLLDKTFPFDEADEAFKYLESGKHVGKVIISVP